MAKPVPKLTEAEQAMENYRDKVRQEELLARMNKAIWEKMYYFVEGTRLVPEWIRLQEEQEKLRAEKIAESDKAIDQVFAEHQAETEAPGSGSLQIISEEPVD